MSLQQQQKSQKSINDISLANIYPTIPHHILSQNVNPGKVIFWWLKFKLIEVIIFVTNWLQTSSPLHGPANSELTAFGSAIEGVVDAGGDVM